ncbi:MAG: hypothetical protein R2855_04615 [Thermomicrobiales bacterium]
MLDVGAKVEVHQLIDELAGQGMAIMLISSDLPEVLAMSDRILIMREAPDGDSGSVEATQEGPGARYGTGSGIGRHWRAAAMEAVDALIDAGSSTGD